MSVLATITALCMKILACNILLSVHLWDLIISIASVFLKPHVAPAVS